MIWVGSRRLWEWAFGITAAGSVLSLAAFLLGTRWSAVSVVVGICTLVYLWRVKP